MSTLTTHQTHLESILRRLFPAESPLVNSRKDSSVQSSTSKLFWELDIFLPALKLAFEFQDEYHYITTWYNQSPLENVQSIDYAKNERVRKQGVTLIHIPCWWNAKAESLIAIIKFYRPELLPHFPLASSLTPLSPPHDFFSVTMVPDVGGEVMLASVVPLSSQFNFWWYGEKYDGIRCVWNPNLHRLYARSGNILEIPDNFLSLISSNRLLDGELWYGRGGYLEAQNVARGEINVWDFLRIIVFDDATPSGQLLPFEMRYYNVLQSVNLSHPFMNISWRAKIQAKRSIKKHIKIIIRNIIENEGEGIILRKPASLYEKGRSVNLLKVKAIRNEIEALVIGRKKSNHTISLQLPNGHRMKIISPDYIRKVKTGDIVTIKFETHSQKNIPVTPSIHRIRRDVTWKDIVLGNTSSNTSILKLSSKDSSPVLGIVKRLREGTNDRYVLETFAKINNFDPLIAENWYPITRNQFTTHSGSLGLLQHYKKLSKALISVFPDVSFQESKFISKSARYWHDLGKRKLFFDKYAKRKGFDPLIAANWYDIPQEAIHAEPDARSILYYYSMSVVHALVHLYPDIGLREEKFIRDVRYWDTAGNRRRLFDRIAEKNSFDPLIPGNWYSLSIKAFLAHRDAPLVLKKYEGNFVKALMDLYPDIGLKEHKFERKKSHRHWNDIKNRRKVFDRYASEKAFDPLKEQNWYQFSRNEIVKDKEVSAVLEHYNGSMIKALIHLYPDVQFNPMMVASKNSNDFWKDTTNQREFFLNIASTLRFDPLVPSNWYSIPKSTIHSYKNVTAALKYYNGNYVQALIYLFPDVSFSEKRFSLEKKRFWFNAQNRVDLFREYARENHFDPLVPDHWYTIQTDQILSFEGARGLLSHYEGDMTRALIDTFPNIGFKKRNFIR